MDFIYVCLFSNGHIKVGRSKTPDKRIQSHADRVSCLGVGLDKTEVYPCSGNVLYAEKALIEYCRGTCSVGSLNEWFEGLDFADVCKKAAESIADSFGKAAENSESAIYIDKNGGPAAVARLLGLKSKNAVQRVSNWRTRGIPLAVLVNHPRVFGPISKCQRLLIGVDQSV